MKKKVDQKILQLIENIIKLHQRGFFVIIGDKGRNQVVNLYYYMVKHSNKAKPKVLWCYKKDLTFSSHHKKRMNQIKKLKNKGVYNEKVDDPFELFLSSSEIRYVYYKETQKILGNTYQMLVLQDFESVTPNVLCRTIETVEGGGLVVMLLKTMSSLKQFYTLMMDVHSRYRTALCNEIQPRFNERFLLSLKKCENCIIMDEELNILPISSNIEAIKPINNNDSTELRNKKELEDLKLDMNKNQAIGPLVNLAKTIDQAKAIMIFAESIIEKNYRSTISLTAGRGRGKSAAMGLSLSIAIKAGFSNIFVTAPSPENLTTFFQFFFLGLETLGYKDNLHYEIIQSTNKEFNNAIIRVNIFKSHRQVVQYIMPQDYNKLTQADLLIIDEAAAIPLPFVKSLLGPYVVFLASTINGYEGTGRSLSLKLLSQLRDQNKIISQNSEMGMSGTGTRALKEITLEDPIRYSLNDPIEAWLNNLLLLNATSAPQIESGLPHPDNCELYLINRETLFSFHNTAERFLFNMMSLFISSHYKNSPNDLQLLSDAPAQLIFALVGNQDKNQAEGEKVTKNKLPDILCLIQIGLEGQISQSLLSHNQNRGIKPSGDLIPWTISEYYQDSSFAQLFGARVIRIATHPMAQGMGYGSKALQLLQYFFEGKLMDISLEEKNIKDIFSFELRNPTKTVNETTELSQIFQKDGLKTKKGLKPLLQNLGEIKPPFLNYLGVSFGVTKNLLKFWSKNNYTSLYLKTQKNEITAEHSGIMVKIINSASQTFDMDEEFTVETSWLSRFENDFKKRFISLLGYEFKNLDLSLCLSILNPNISTSQIASAENDMEIEDNSKSINKNELSIQINIYDLHRLQSYAKNMINFQLILDLVPTIAKLFFTSRFEKHLKLSYVQAAILLGMGLQYKTVEKVSSELNIPISQALALFNKLMRKISNEIQKVYEKDIEKDIKDEDTEKVATFNPIKKQDQELEEEGRKVVASLSKQQISEKKKKLQNQKPKANYSVDDINTDNITISTSKSIIVPRSIQNAEKKMEKVENKSKKVKKQQKFQNKKK